ncbi:hypothetical protein [Sulfurospirillum cavolei]|uniref:hypothetical protein n=1 Tax=Sulfurospirillum cavolei TaxID=366522 RepID=UPI000764BF19|nr:hypothetical protein [Sulfurospirillum cavolei]
MRKTSVKLLLAYLAGDVAVLAVSLMQGGNWLLNTQAAFACSLLITFASFYSYHRMVQSRLAAGAIPPDKFEHYYEDDDEESEKENEDATMQDSPLESEKKPPKIGFKESFQNLSLSYKSALSVYRIATYGILFLTLLVLVHKSRFDAVAFLIGLSVIPLCGLFGAVFLKKDFYGTYES